MSDARNRSGGYGSHAIRIERTAFDGTTRPTSVTVAGKAIFLDRAYTASDALAILQFRGGNCLNSGDEYVIVASAIDAQLLQMPDQYRTPYVPITRSELTIRAGLERPRVDTFEWDKEFDFGPLPTLGSK